MNNSNLILTLFHFNVSFSTKSRFMPINVLSLFSDAHLKFVYLLKNFYFLSKIELFIF